MVLFEHVGERRMVANGFEIDQIFRGLLRSHLLAAGYSECLIFLGDLWRVLKQAEIIDNRFALLIGWLPGFVIVVRLLCQWSVGVVKNANILSSYVEET